MAANLLKSKEAVNVSVNVVRAFVQLRQMVIDVQALEEKIEKMEKKYDAQFAEVFKIIRQMIIPPEQPKNKIGFI